MSDVHIKWNATSVNFFCNLPRQYIYGLVRQICTSIVYALYSVSYLYKHYAIDVWWDGMLYPEGFKLKCDRKMCIIECITIPGLIPDNVQHGDGT